MLRLVATIVGIALINTPTLADHHGSDLVKKLAGVWEIEDGRNQGESLTEEDLEGKVIIKGNEIVSYDKDEKELYRATFTVNPDADPIEITMTASMRGKTLESLGILKLEEKDDEMWLCYGLPDSPRPTEFKSPGDSRNMLFELQRKKDETKDVKIPR